jgi:hypothetical protein
MSVFPGDLSLGDSYRYSVDKPLHKLGWFIGIRILITLRVLLEHNVEGDRLCAYNFFEFLVLHAVLA